jgi:predicted ribosome quality control (RQC) complex YloA/Tae2 family protein
MPPLTLNQAAKAAGKSKQTLLDAIRGGRLSAPKDEQGRYQIDPAELFRAYPQTGLKPVSETATDPARPDTQTTLFERIIAGLENERDDLRRRLDQSEESREKEAAERREAQTKLTALLTHQPEAKAPTDQKPDTETGPGHPETNPVTAGFLGASAHYWAILAFTATGAAIWLWWNH